MLKYTHIAGTIPEGITLDLSGEYPVVHGVGPLSSTANPPTIQTLAGRLGVIQAGEPTYIPIRWVTRPSREKVGLSVIRGSMPLGLQLQADGIHGAPVVPQISFLDFLPEEAPVWVTKRGLLDIADENIVYSHPLSVTAYQSRPISFSVVDGMLPLGLTLNPSTGEISGKTSDLQGEPDSENKVVVWTSRVLDNRVYYEKTDLDPPLVLTATLVGGSEGDTLSYRVVGGGLPLGIRLRPNGEFAGSFHELAGGTDERYRHGSGWGNTRLPTGTVGQAYTFDLKTIVDAVYAIKSLYLVEGRLPLGTRMNSVGVITGTPTEAGDFSFQCEGMLEPDYHHYKYTITFKVN